MSLVEVTYEIFHRLKIKSHVGLQKVWTTLASGLEFSLSPLLGGSLPPVTPAPGDLIPSSGLCGHLHAYS